MVYVFLAEGFEEGEAILPIDLLRRAGISVRLVGICGKQVISAHKVTVQADITINEVDLSAAELLFLPGGMPGTKNLFASDALKQIVLQAYQDGKYITAICAAPSIVLGGLGLLQGKRAICYPGMEGGMTGATVIHQNVVQDGKIITGRALGGAMDLSLTFVKVLCGEEKAKEVANGIAYYDKN